MSLNLPDYAGNMGHKDQVLAFKWIDKNIKQFGGGGKTTLIGHDSGKNISDIRQCKLSARGSCWLARPAVNVGWTLAEFALTNVWNIFRILHINCFVWISFARYLGAISVSLHMISPASQGLFENAIMLSGSALNPSIPRVKDHLTILYNVAENLHYPVDNNRDLLEFLKQVDAKLLIQRTFQDFSNSGFGRRMANLIWSTVIERENKSQSPARTLLMLRHFRSTRRRQIHGKNAVWYSH